MKLFKEFLGEATQPEWRVSFKKQKMNGVAVDEKPVTVKARDSREAIVKAAKKVGISDKSVAMQMKTKSIDKLDESLTEAKYEVEVEVRDARAANDLAKDMFRGSYKNDGSNVFIFKNEDDYEDFKYELENAGLKLMEQTQVDEAVSIDPEFMKISKMLSDVKNTFRDVVRKVKAETDMPVRQYQSTVDKIEDQIESLRKDLDKAQTELKKL